MRDPEVKRRELRLRRAAERQGLKLQRSPRRDPHALEYGTYQLINPDANTVVAAGFNTGYGLSLDQIESILTEEVAS